MDERTNPYTCEALLGDLHLVIGGDLEAGRLDAAREHIDACADCSRATVEAQRLRQVYFAVASQAASEPLDLWPNLRETLAADGLFGARAPREPELAAPAQHVSEPATTPQGVLSTSAFLRDEVLPAGEARRGVLASPFSPGRLTAMGLAVGTAAALFLVPMLRDHGEQETLRGVGGSGAVADGGADGSVERASGAAAPALAEGLRTIELDERLASEPSLTGFAPVWSSPQMGDERFASFSAPKGYELR